MVRLSFDRCSHPMSEGYDLRKGCRSSVTRLGIDMKLKCLPEDFRVEELSLARPDGPGRYTFYRLSKQGLGTLEAVEAICRRWNLSGRRVSYAGLKDRHASTIQYLTIVDGPWQSLNASKFQLEPAGRLDRAYTSQLLRGNRFEVVLRGLSEDELVRAISEIDSIASVGLPNYFDDQRFGSVGYSGEFAAHAWLLGDHERALRLALAEPNPFDRAAMKSEKAILRTQWGHWAEAKSLLPRSSARSIVTYLVDHPTDYRGAFARLRRELRMLYFSAFQSHLWNLMLARWFERNASADQLVPVSLKVGTFPFPRRMEPERVRTLIQTMLPLPCCRSPLPEGRLGEIIAEFLQGFGLAWSDLRIKHLKDIFFSKGVRPCLFFPERLEFTPIDDDLHPGRRGLRLSFELAKGSYATILVKRLTDVASVPR
jgi:tRNA pseudouridine13 synthase